MCTSIWLDDDNRLLGQTYDFYHGHGLVTGNPAGLEKVALGEDEQVPARWASRFGSLTFNRFARELPVGGINPESLAVASTWHDGVAPTVFPGGNPVAGGSVLKSIPSLRSARMNKLIRSLVILLLAPAVLASCAPPPAAAGKTQASATVPLATEAPTATPEPTIPAGPSLQTATYRDEVAGFEFDHPAGWSVGPVEQHSRGSITAFTSWERPTDVLPGPTPPGETRVDATVQLWEPTGDLEAFLDQRKGAWDASGIKVVSEETWTLDDGRPARAFVVAGSDGAQAFFFFTTLGDKYLVLSGDGDLGLLAEIAQTVRPIAFAGQSGVHVLYA